MCMSSSAILASFPVKVEQEHMENNIAMSVDGLYLPVYTASTYIRFEWVLA